MAINVFIKLASKFKSDLRRQFKDSMTYPQAAGKPDHKSAKETANKAFDYIEKSANPTQAKNRAQEMFGDFDIDGAIEEAGGFDKAFKATKPQKKSLGGLLTSKASQRRQSGAIMDSKLQPVRGRKNGGFVTKWESKWG